MPRGDGLLRVCDASIALFDAGSARRVDTNSSPTLLHICYIYSTLTPPFSLVRAGRRTLDARSIRRSNLLSAFQTVDSEEDINAVNDYFSYEHFYVLYCKFWELDSDHDFLLSRAVRCALHSTPC